MKQSNILKILRANMSLVSFFLVQTGHLVWLDRLYSGSLSKVKGAERPGLLRFAWFSCQRSSSSSKIQEQRRGKEEVEKLRRKKKDIVLGAVWETRSSLYISIADAPRRPGRGHGFFLAPPLPLSLGGGCKRTQTLAQRNNLKRFRNKKSCVKLNLCYW